MQRAIILQRRRAIILQRSAIILQRSAIILQKRASILQRRASIFQKRAIMLHRRARILQRRAIILQWRAIIVKGEANAYRFTIGAVHGLIKACKVGYDERVMIRWRNDRRALGKVFTGYHHGRRLCKASQQIWSTCRCGCLVLGYSGLESVHRDCV